MPAKWNRLTQARLPASALQCPAAGLQMRHKQAKREARVRTGSRCLPVATTPPCAPGHSPEQPPFRCKAHILLRGWNVHSEHHKAPALHNNEVERLDAVFNKHIAAAVHGHLSDSLGALRAFISATRGRLHRPDPRQDRTGLTGPDQERLWDRVDLSTSAPASTNTFAFKRRRCASVCPRVDQRASAKPNPRSTLRH
jgi:hypothetical protein